MSYLTSASGLLSWLLGIQLSVGSRWEPPDVPFPTANLCFFSFFPVEEDDDGAEDGTLPLVALWPRGEELSVALLLAFLQFLEQEEDEDEQEELLSSLSNRFSVLPSSVVSLLLFIWFSIYSISWSLESTDDGRMLLLLCCFLASPPAFPSFPFSLYSNSGSVADVFLLAGAPFCDTGGVSTSDIPLAAAAAERKREVKQTHVKYIAARIHENTVNFSKLSSIA